MGFIKTQSPDVAKLNSIQVSEGWATPHGQQIRQILADNFKTTFGGFGLAK